MLRFTSYANGGAGGRGPDHDFLSVTGWLAARVAIEQVAVVGVLKVKAAASAF